MGLSRCGCVRGESGECLRGFFLILIEKGSGCTYLLKELEIFIERKNQKDLE